MRISIALLAAFFTLIFLTPAQAQWHCEAELAAKEIRYYSGPDAYFYLVNLFKSKEGHYRFRDPTFDAQMQIELMGPNNSEYSPLDRMRLSFRAHKYIAANDSSRTLGWKQVYVDRPSAADWREAVKQRLAGDGYVRLRLTEYILPNGLRFLRVIQSTPRFDIKPSLVEFTLKTSAQGAVIGILGKGTNLTYEKRGAVENFGGTSAELVDGFRRLPPSGP